ncbi:MAG: hypothetical protein A4E30_01068 [Methanomassiliicoccales archaeon PtaB.Bin215]|nr:MAG: hypothetical protein A4E30_01068 [Methanomassiliicoccales archaeon PtaB.Bin215]
MIFGAQRAMVAATKAVMPPMAPTNSATSALVAMIGKDLATRYTPALTMVAACIKADTVVGPSIASGSQSCSGNWALLPIAPPNRKKAAKAIMAGSAVSRACQTSS